MSALTDSTVVVLLQQLVAQHGSPDWNWFYSTLAQSTAALVGILCAFGISRLIGNQGAVQSIQGRVAEFRARAVSLTAQTKLIRFDFIQSVGLRRGLHATARGITSTTGLATAQRLYKEHGRSFSSFVMEADAIEAIEESRSDYEESKSRGQNAGDFLGRFFFDGASELRVAEANAESLAIDIEDHIASLASLLRDMKAIVEHSKVVAACLLGAALLYVIGVLIPLSQLPSRPANASFVQDAGLHHSAPLLTAVSVVFLGMIAYLLALNVRSHLPREEMAACTEYTRMSSYDLGMHTYFLNVTEHDPSRLERIQQSTRLLTDFIEGGWWNRLRKWLTQRLTFISPIW